MAAKVGQKATLAEQERVAEKRNQRGPGQLKSEQRLCFPEKPPKVTRMRQLRRLRYPCTKPVTITILKGKRTAIHDRSHGTDENPIIVSRRQLPNTMSW